MHALTISVIVPTWKRPAKLKICLEHLELQETKAYEILVVMRKEDVDGIAVAKLFIDKIPEMKILYTELPGVINAENIGLSNAKGEVVAFIDDDGYAPSDWLSRIANFYQNFPDAGGYGGSDIIKSEPWTYHDFPVKRVGEITWYGKVIGNHHKKALGEFREVDVLKGVNMSFRRKYLPFLDSKLAGIDGHLGNGSQWELDVCLAVKAQGVKIFFDPDLVVTHDSDHSTHVKEIVMINNAHNLSYVMAKHFHGFRYFVFLLFALVFGSEQLPGVIKTLVTIVREKNVQSIKFYRGKLQGFFQGICTYRKSTRS